jgi:hypothetical protein
VQSNEHHAPSSDGPARYGYGNPVPRIPPGLPMSARVSVAADAVEDRAAGHWTAVAAGPSDGEGKPPGPETLRTCGGGVVQGRVDPDLAGQRRSPHRDGMRAGFQLE